MKILIITSCTGEKAHAPHNQLTQADFELLHDEQIFRQKEQALSEFSTKAEDLYTGQQHVRLMNGIRSFGPENVDLWILSAGYGLIPGNRQIAPYECTFATMKTKELKTWSDHLHVPQDIRKVLSQQYDLALVLLGDGYLKSCQLNDKVTLGGPTLLFCGGNMAPHIPDLPQLRKVTLSNAEAKRFSCGLVGLKGEVSKRLLSWVSAHTDTFLSLFDPTTDVLNLLDNGSMKSATGKKSLVNPTVDQVISIPQTWWDKPHRQTLSYFIPEWDDLVDPDFDFENDNHSGGTGNWANEVYAHQMYREPNYDGILISKVIAEKSKSKKKRINDMGVHRYARVPQEFPIMGDCGAFGYIMDEVPPYTTAEIIDYYTRLGFNYGVSVDHLIVSATESQKQFRYDLTINNAEEFLRENKRQGLPWEPVGAVQGWDPKSYAEAARQYVAMGYKYIGLGGLVRSTSTEILRILTEVHKYVPADVKIHLFGIARFKVLKQFADLGVRSVDSASFLRRAWLGTGQNYLNMDGHQYAAIRIPEPGKSFRAKRMVSEGRSTFDEICRMEKACLQSMKDFDAGQLSVEATLDILEEYDNLITPDRKSNRHHLQRTLEAAPWKTCPCEICRKDGVQVIIFRGNNRNRRRGFHNTYVFYRFVQRALAGEKITIGTDEDDLITSQPSLFEADEGI